MGGGFQIFNQRSRKGGVATALVGFVGMGESCYNGGGGE